MEFLRNSGKITLMGKDLRKGTSVPTELLFTCTCDLITGKHGQRDIRYVFVDEVKISSTYQLAYLKYRFPRAKFTLLGRP